MATGTDRFRFSVNGEQPLYVFDGRRPDHVVVFVHGMGKARPNILFHLTENIPRELGLLAVAPDLAERCGTREKAAAADIIDRLRPGL